MTWEYVLGTSVLLSSGIVFIKLPVIELNSIILSTLVELVDGVGNLWSHSPVDGSLAQKLVTHKLPLESNTIPSGRCIPAPPTRLSYVLAASLLTKMLNVCLEGSNVRMYTVKGL